MPASSHIPPTIPGPTPAVAAALRQVVLKPIAAVPATQVPKTWRSPTGLRLEPVRVPNIAHDKVHKTTKVISSNTTTKTRYQRGQEACAHRQVLDAVVEAGGNKTRAAKLLGISRQAVYEILARG